MAKFKVGDKVCCVKHDDWLGRHAEPGHEGTVTRLPDWTHHDIWFEMDGNFHAYTNRWTLVPIEVAQTPFVITPVGLSVTIPGDPDFGARIDDLDEVGETSLDILDSGDVMTLPRLKAIHALLGEFLKSHPSA